MARFARAHLCCTSVLCLTPHATLVLSFFFFNDTATTEIYTLSLHDALPISPNARVQQSGPRRSYSRRHCTQRLQRSEEHTSNSSHSQISYAVFCLKKKKKKKTIYLDKQVH